MQWVHRERILIADGRTGELVAIDRLGEATHLCTSLHRDAVSAAVVDYLETVIQDNLTRFGSFTAASLAEARARIGEAGDPLPLVWSAVVPDVQGGVWLQRAACAQFATPSPTTAWEVVSAEGRLLAVVEVPTELTIVAADGDRVLVAALGDLDVQRVGVYRSRR
jgi:hypothetical protein